MQSFRRHYAFKTLTLNWFLTILCTSKLTSNSATYLQIMHSCSLVLNFSVPKWNWKTPHYSHWCHCIFSNFTWTRIWRGQIRPFQTAVKLFLKTVHNSTYVLLLLLNMTLPKYYSPIVHQQNINLKILDMKISD